MDFSKIKFPGWPWVSDFVRILAPIPLTFCAAAMVLVLWKGDWPIETAEQRIQFLGLVALGTLVLLGLALFLNRQGISSFSLKGPGGVELNINEPEKPSGN